MVFMWRSKLTIFVVGLNCLRFCVRIENDLGFVYESKRTWFEWDIEIDLVCVCGLYMTCS